MTIQVPVRLTEEDVSRLDAAVASGRYRSRSDALRRGLELVLRDQREREIEEAYRRGYGKYPQEDWVGEVGLALFAARARAEEAGQEPL